MPAVSYRYRKFVTIFFSEQVMFVDLPMVFCLRAGTSDLTLILPMARNLYHCFYEYDYWFCFLTLLKTVIQQGRRVGIFIYLNCSNFKTITRTFQLCHVCSRILWEAHILWSIHGWYWYIRCSTWSAEYLMSQNFLKRIAILQFHWAERTIKSIKDSCSYLYNGEKLGESEQYLGNLHLGEKVLTELWKTDSAILLCVSLIWTYE